MKIELLMQISKKTKLFYYLATLMAITIKHTTERQQELIIKE
jgi:hypothetical protein